MKHLLLFLLLLPSFAAAQDGWKTTPVETANFEATPGNQETIEYLQELDRRMPEMQLGFYGDSPQSRAMPLVVVSKEGAFTPAAALKTGKPVVMIQNGIHAGEIDGKDASLMILRDLAMGQHRELLDKVILVILPIYNVDGHTRVSPYNRPNQDGPRQGMGFRTTAAGLDLNRDHLKAASPEAQALMKLVSDWRPHLHVDDHVTDGVDHDWVLTWSWAEAPQAPLQVDLWLREHMPAVLAATEKAGHRAGPYVDLKDGNDPSKGFSSWIGPPRYATGYYPLRNRPSILVEMHSYKPYKQRVLANREFLLALLAEVARDPESLIRAVSEAEAATVALGKPDAKPSTVAVVYEESEAADTIRFPVYAHETIISTATGGPILRYRRGQVQEMEVPWYHRPKVALAVPRPRGYLVLPGWPQIEQRLRTHGLHFSRVSETPEGTELEVETIRVSEPKFAPRSYQGLHQVEAKVERRTERRPIPNGAIWIPADQPDFAIAVQLFEPEAPDSLLSWGLLSSVFEQKEYIDTRVLEELAAEMIKDPKTAAEFQEAMKDEKLAKDPFARYQWWYRRTPYWDETIGLLPVYRVMRVMQAPKFRMEPGR
ncbi:MAG TPA: M14 family metallopeptidase [Thermoanaerobaculia bacterium]|nr:M14 family metallopeptidase [Thermoanaerobaculia bacterium]